MSAASGKPRVHALVPAAGAGSRFGAEVPKQYLAVAGKAVIEHAVGVLASHPAVEGVTVTLAPDDDYFVGLALGADPTIGVVAGGATRAESVLNGLAYIRDQHDAEWVLVHDAARPGLDHAAIDRLLEAGLSSPDGALLALPIRDTLKRADADGCVAATVDREDLWAAQTPQLFPVQGLLDALQAQLDAGETPTDEAQAMERAGARPRLVMGSGMNLKVTWPEDLLAVRAWLGAGADADGESAGNGSDT
ncbi:2-C-methyl-D-erythritol 4-phosphate cytidylyltransferase [Marinihelvus fidelis]|uniref:2-C-methyl-D-erythritol 4-phosphate cytidylyltransferase n=1 Tax=Marinihelvus fidelis TaxID=2613842 RepID=A0A5N0T481_9GAMM|nr:2-C-methyl-D-erythritol 4-phosphate cytidylyltransferase [Marinihelvus fidelis]KAA9129875.1 2-C-methyl-D-erythritol 4-phosphate cytidylyltransferase [Marinihelvus fidelis]